MNEVDSSPPGFNVLLRVSQSFSTGALVKRYHRCLSNISRGIVTPMPRHLLLSSRIIAVPLPLKELRDGAIPSWTTMPL